MVSTYQYTALITFVCLGILIPVLLPILLHKRFFKLRLMPILVGAGIFFIMVNVLEALMHLYVLKINSYTKLLFENPWLFAIYGCFAAAFFEETGRLIAFKFLLKKYRLPSDGISYGLGHGGFEFLIIAAGGAVSSLVLATMINNGTFDSTLGAKNITEEQMVALKDSILNVNFSNVLLGITERCGAIAMQLGMSMLVFYAVIKRNFKYYFLAFAFHFIADFPAALYQKKMITSVVWIELLLVPYAIAGIVIAFKLYKKINSEKEPEIEVAQL